ncbi:MAG: hypothetical protein LBB17_02340 [Puniceicoccales bacterium]|jgi:hypothetical protein|nr:hypothetical protein [Puniceicoccales bacterium]
MENFKRVGRERGNFVIFERSENGIPTIFKIHPGHEEEFKKIAVHTTNAEFGLAAGTADCDGHAVLKNIPLGDRTAAISFDVSPRGYKRRPAYKVTFINETKNE